MNEVMPRTRREQTIFARGDRAGKVQVLGDLIRDIERLRKSHTDMAMAYEACLLLCRVRLDGLEAQVDR